MYVTLLKVMREIQPNELPFMNQHILFGAVFPLDRVSDRKMKLYTKQNNCSSHNP